MFKRIFKTLDNDHLKIKYTRFFLFIHSFIPFFHLFICFCVYWFVCLFSFEEDAEVKCEEVVEKAVSANKENPEAFLLKANFLLAKDKKEVTN